MTLADDDGKLVPTHPEDSDLVAYLDGERSASEQETTRAHLESCWECRIRLADFQDAIARFMRVRQGVLPDGAPPAPAAIEPFRARLARHGDGSAAGLAHLKRTLRRWADVALPSFRERRPTWVATATIFVLAIVTGPLWAHGRLLSDFRMLVEETWVRFVGADRPPSGPAVLRALPRDIHAPKQPAVAPGAARRVRPLPLSYANSIANDAEVTVASALHRLDACLGEEINVFQMSDGSMLVQGLVDSRERREQLVGALAGLRLRLRVGIHIPDELTAGAELYEPPEQPARLDPPRALGPIRLFESGATAEMPMRERLERHVIELAGGATSADPLELRRRVAAFANELVTLSRQSLFQAWALRDLDVEFSPERVRRLPPRVLHRIDELRQEHRASVREGARRLALKLSELEQPADPAFATRDIEAAADGASVLRLVSEQDELIRSLFSSSSTPRSDADLAKLVALLRQSVGPR